MKILVGVKRVIDYNVSIRVKSDGSGVEKDGVKMSMNPFDEIAVEQALKIKEAGGADEVIAVSIGPAKAEDTLRTALAMGADRAILVESTDEVEPLAVAKILKAVAEQESVDMVLVGKQAIDDDSNQTGQMLSALLNWSQGTFISEMEIKDGAVALTREIDGGLEDISVKLPTVLTVDLRLNEPRYASLPNIMKAKKKPLDKVTADSLGVDTAPRLSVVNVVEPPTRKAGIVVSSVAELAEKINAARG
jgi:electron transfer flavoprotein beta subunit